MRALLLGLCFWMGAIFSLDARAATLAKTPPMGWNSWDAYGFTLDEASFKENAEVLAGLRRYGWQYAVIDEGWYMSNPGGADRETRGYQLDGNGRLIPAPNRFPSATHDAGLRALADWTHARGLKLGIHIVRGIPKGALPAMGESPIRDITLPMPRLSRTPVLGTTATTGSATTLRVRLITTQ